jgi:DNA-binding SARP family transcriptional activator/streptogramin lyase
MEFRILGPLEVEDAGRLLPLGGTRQRALLALLLLHANEVVSQDTLIDQLWGGKPPDSGRTALQVHVSQLRRLLDPDATRGDEELLVTRAPGYTIRVEHESIDLGRFEELLAAGKSALATGDAQAAHDRLTAALALWRGRALADIETIPFAQAEARRLEELRLGTLEERLDADLALGRHAQVIPELERLVAQEPLRERIRGQLMLALYRSGRQAEALEVYRTARRTLAEDLGLEPGEALQQLERAILNHDPELSPPKATRAPESSHSQRRVSTLRRGRTLAVVGAVLLGGAAAAAVALSRDSGQEIVIAADSLGVIDPSSNRIVAAIPVGSQPSAVTVGEGAVWVANSADGTVSRVDPETRRVVETIGIGAPAIDVAAGEGAVWTANGSDGTITEIDPRTNTVVQSIDLRGGDALAPDETNAIAVGFGSVWVARGAREILRIDPRTGAISATIDVHAQAADVAVSKDSVWTATSAERVLRIEPRTNNVVAEAALAGFPVSLAIGPGTVWVGTYPTTVWRIDSSSTTVAGTVKTGTPTGITARAVDVWVADGRRVLRLDPRTNAVTRRIQIAAVAADVAMDADAVYVAAAPT